LLQKAGILDAPKPNKVSKPKAKPVEAKKG